MTGRRRRLRIVRRYRRDVIAGLDELRRVAAAGAAPDRNRTVGQYLDWWLADVKTGQMTAAGLA